MCLGESCSLCGEPSSSSILLLPSAPPPSTYSTKKRGWVAKEWPYQIRERERGKEEEEEDELCFFSSSKNEKKKTNTPHPRHHARHPQLAFSLEHSIRINFPFFFSSYKRKTFYLFIFFFLLPFLLYIWWFFGDPTPVFSWIPLLLLTNQPPTKLFYALYTTVNWMDGIVSKERKCFLPIWPFFHVVRTTTGHGSLLFSSMLFNPIIWMEVFVLLQRRPNKLSPSCVGLFDSVVERVIQQDSHTVGTDRRFDRIDGGGRRRLATSFFPFLSRELLL